jgi:hypothetical protein
MSWGKNSGGSPSIADLMKVISSLAPGKGWGGKGKGKGMDKETSRKLSEASTDCKMWIGGLPKTLSWKDLEAHVEKVAGTKPSVSEAWNGTGVCVFKTAEEATAAILAVNGTFLQGSSVEADVWTAKEPSAKGSGNEKWELVEKIKDMQRSDPTAKQKWWEYTDQNHGGVHDPKRHDVTVLQGFVSQMELMGMVIPGSGSEKWELVKKIKDMQRSDPAAKQKWWDYTDQNLGGVHDPKKHDVTVLQTFLTNMQLMGEVNLMR